MTFADLAHLRVVPFMLGMVFGPMVVAALIGLVLWVGDKRRWW